MEFKAEVDLEYDDFLAWNKVYAKTNGRKRGNILKALWIILAAIMLACVVFLIMIDGMDATMVACVALFILAAVIMIFKNRINAKTTQKMYLKGIGTQYITFDSDGIYQRHNKGETKYFYSTMTAVYTEGSTFFLLLDEKHAVVIPKRSFTEGDPEAFDDFISEKTGLEVKKIDV